MDVSGCACPVVCWLCVDYFTSRVQLGYCLKPKN